MEVNIREIWGYSLEHTEKWIKEHAAIEILFTTVTGVATYFVTNDIVPSIAAPLGAVLLILFAVFVFFLVRAPEAIKQEKANKQLNVQMADNLTESMKAWLSSSFGDIPVKRAAFFGSVVNHYPVRDVDLMLVLSLSPDRSAVRRVRHQLESASRDFLQVFGHPLHYQLFFDEETQALETFTKNAGRLEDL